MRMAYTSTILLLAALLCVSAVAESTKLSRNSHDGICKTMVETRGYVCEEHQVPHKNIAWFLVYKKAFSLCDNFTNV